MMKENQLPQKLTPFSRIIVQQNVKIMACAIVVQLPHDMSINHREVMRSRDCLILVHNMHPHRAHKSVGLIF